MGSEITLWVGDEIYKVESVSFDFIPQPLPDYNHIYDEAISRLYDGLGVPSELLEEAPSYSDQYWNLFQNTLSVEAVLNRLFLSPEPCYTGERVNWLKEGF